MVLFLEDGFVKSDMDVRPDHWRSLKISWNMLKLALNLIYWWSYVVFYIFYGCLIGIAGKLFNGACFENSFDYCDFLMAMMAVFWEYVENASTNRMNSVTVMIIHVMSCLLRPHSFNSFQTKKPCKRVDQKTAKKPHAGILFGPLRQPIAIGKTHQPGTLPGCKSSGIQRRLPGYQLRIALAQTGAIVRHQGVTQLVFPDQSVRHSTSLGPFLRFLQAPEMLITQAINILPVCFLHPGSC